MLRVTAGTVSRSSSHRSSVLLFFVFLALSYLGLSVHAAQTRIRSALDGLPAAAFVGPAALLAAALAYALATGLPIGPRAGPYTGYLFVPALLWIPGRRSTRPSPLRALAAAAAVWLPLEFRLLPSLPLPPPDGFDAIRLVGIVAAFYLFLVARPIDKIGYTFLLDRRDCLSACLAFAGFAVVALPLGLVSGFLAWHPQLNATNVLLTPAIIYLTTAVPEEFLFRGLIQNVFARIVDPRAALIAASVVFGLAHLPDLRYVALATLAGVAYGWVYARTGKITASALTHAAVDWIWVVLLRR
jgi:membrane protease YdiL (CAAX protease family)